MSSELSDTPTDARSRTPTHTETPVVSAPTLDGLRARLRAFRHLRPDQLAPLVVLLTLVAAVAAAPAALTAFLALFGATIALLVVVPLLAVHANTR